jgi:HSP20 family protein
MNTLAAVPKNGTLSKTNLNDNFSQLSQLLDGFFNREMPSTFTSNFNTGMSVPKVNIKENPEEFIVEMAVPGQKKSDFKLDIDNKVLSISTSKEEEQEQNDENYTFREFGYSSFKRTFTLPNSVNDDEIRANYEDGILKVVLPKKEEAKQKPARNIEIS